jgi:hypothetical protein
MKKIALIITGAPRLYKFTSKNLRLNLLDCNENCTFHVFMCIQLANMQSPERNRKYDNKYYDENDIVNTYRPTKHFVMNTGNQHDKLVKCVQMIKEHEKENNIMYDFVFKIRFETYFFNKFNFQDIFHMQKDEIVTQWNICRDINVSNNLKDKTIKFMNNIIDHHTFNNYLINNAKEINETCNIPDNFITSSWGINFILNTDKIFRCSHTNYEAYLYTKVLFHQLKYLPYSLNLIMCHLKKETLFDHIYFQENPMCRLIANYNLNDTQKALIENLVNHVNMLSYDGADK